MLPLVAGLPWYAYIHKYIPYIFNRVLAYVLLLLYVTIGKSPHILSSLFPLLCLFQCKILLEIELCGLISMKASDLLIILSFLSHAREHDHFNPCSLFVLACMCLNINIPRLTALLAVIRSLPTCSLGLKHGARTRYERRGKVKKNDEDE